jgi:hypothetical protein
MPEVPLPPEVPVDPVKVLVARNDAEGLHLHARTAVPGWMGEYLDVGWAIGILHPLAREEWKAFSNAGWKTGSGQRRSRSCGATQ